MVLKDNVGIENTERLIEFCYPALKVTCTYAPKGKGDIAIPRLKFLFEEKNKEIHLYKDFDEFLDACRMMIPATFVEDGIFTNITYHRWVYTEALKMANGE